MSPPSTWRHGPTLLRVGALAGTVVALVLATLLIIHPWQRANAGHPATMTTASQTPFPTPLPGFALYVEANSGFQLQYPQQWDNIAQNPGIEFDDNAQNPVYIVQVLVPTDSQDANIDWVTYELERLNETTNATNFQRQADVPQRTISGELWNGGEANLTVGADSITVQVYATIHQGKPYLINLIADSDVMLTAQAEYFNTMLDSFTFLS